MKAGPWISRELIKQAQQNNDRFKKAIEYSNSESAGGKEAYF